MAQSGETHAPPIDSPAVEIVPGEKVRITGGPLHGVTGIVERRVGSVRVTVNVEILGQAVATEMDIGDMEVQRD